MKNNYKSSLFNRCRIALINIHDNQTSGHFSILIDCITIFIKFRWIYWIYRKYLYFINCLSSVPVCLISELFVNGLHHSKKVILYIALSTEEYYG